MRKTVVACVVTALVVSGGTATAGVLITSKDIKNSTIKSEDIKNGTIKYPDIKKSTITRDRLAKKVRRQLDEGGAAGPPGAAGPAGARGPAGPPGAKGDPGAPGPQLSSGNWGIMNRNTIGSPSAFLRSGPATPALPGPPAVPAQAPPFGTGSLNLVVAGPPLDPTPERIAYGNEFDFVGDSFLGLTAIGFHVYTTPENGLGNLPTISLEIDPNLTPANNFATVFFVPPGQLPLVWSNYIDATTATWFGTGGAFDATACDDAGGGCTFTALKGLLDNGGDPPLIGTVAITKGRDNSFQGAVDGLRINNTVYDFEEAGVFETAP